jgi:hypothetical protein
MLNKRMLDLGQFPPRIAKLPVSSDGFPVPWFVTWFKDGKPCRRGEGTPDFRIVDPATTVDAIKHSRCWVCGEPLGGYKAFVIGPMCAINRVSAEPPSHHECALFSVRGCPFLSQPRMRRNDKDLPFEGEPADAPGFMLERNPGVTCVWVTKSFTPFRPHAGGSGILIRIGEPTSVFWFAHGREAKREEIMASIDSGYPLLVDLARQDTNPDGAMKALTAQREAALALLPAA